MIRGCVFSAGAWPDSGHGVLAPFEVSLCAPSHPIMEGMPSRGCTPTTNSITGYAGRRRTLRCSPRDFAGDHLNEPMAGRRLGRLMFCHRSGARCEFDARIGFQTLIARGCEWAGVELCHSTCREVSARSDQCRRAGNRVDGSGGETTEPGTIRSQIDRKVRVAGPYAAVRLPIAKGISLHERPSWPLVPTAICMSLIIPARSCGSMTPTAMVWKTPPHWADVTKDGEHTG